MTVDFSSCCILRCRHLTNSPKLCKDNCFKLVGQVKNKYYPKTMELLVWIPCLRGGNKFRLLDKTGHFIYRVSPKKRPLVTLLMVQKVL